MAVVIENARRKSVAQKAWITWQRSSLLIPNPVIRADLIKMFQQRGVEGVL